MSRLLVFSLVLLSVPALAQKTKPGPPYVVTIQTRDMTIEFGGDRAWTPQRISHQNEIITERTGFYGTVMSEEGKKWIGTGHNEGGIEIVEKVTLTVDGKPADLADKATYKCSRAVVEKQSMLGPIKLAATYVVTDDALLERHRYEFTTEITIGTLYAFMHPFLPRTTEWIAQMPDGKMKEGKFDNRGDFKLRDDPKWTAIFDPAAKRATLVWYPQPLQGMGIKTGYWDKTVYHKLYNQLYSHTPVPKGTKVEAQVVVRSVSADEPTWKEKAKALAEDTSASFAKGLPGF
ncbi:MAG: hypothetical protein JNM99_09350 [Verrucomicrobiaceae bacterium]|nr:hypothetical protein [Verrucomicrobiaceae bacterium]